MRSVASSGFRHRIGRHLKGNQRRLEGNRRRLEGNRRRLEGNRRRLEGNRRRLGPPPAALRGVPGQRGRGHPVASLGPPPPPRWSSGSRSRAVRGRRGARARRQPSSGAGHWPRGAGNRRSPAVTIRFSSVATAARWRLPSVVRRLTCDNRQGQPSWRAPDRCWLARPLPSATRHSPLVPWFGGVPELGRPGPCGRPVPLRSGRPWRQTGGARPPSRVPFTNSPSQERGGGGWVLHLPSTLPRPGPPLSPPPPPRPSRCGEHLPAWGSS